MGSKKTKGIDRFLSRLRRAYRPEKILLFGSRARGEEVAESDYDLLIVSSRFRGMCFRERIVKVLRLVDRPSGVEPICLTPEEFEEGSRRITVVREAAREGVEV